MPALNVGMIFGGRSVEHEVSVITAQQVMAALPPERFRPVPLYIAKSGRWYTGDVLRELPRYRDVAALLDLAEPVTFPVDPGAGGLLQPQTQRRGGLFGRGRSTAGLPRIDVAFPLVHGSHGEDGTLAGLCELADLPYVGCGVAAAAVAMDKALAKAVWRSAGLPVLDELVVVREHWRSHPESVVAAVRDRVGLPAYVKPATLGSSIGVSRVVDDVQLGDALDLSAAYSERAVVEAAQDDIVEINCSVLGAGDRVRASVLEQPQSQGLLSYQDKYSAGHGAGKGAVKGSPGGKQTGMQSARRIIPAPIDEQLTQRISETALAAFTSLGAAGVARVDFLVRPERGWFVLNEINPIPGSLSFYLWEPAGLSFAGLCTELIDLAQRRHAEKRQSTYSIDSWLLTGAGIGGAKGKASG